MVVATIPFSAFRVPNGKVAVTFDLHGCDVFTGVISVGDVESFLKAFEKALDLSTAKRQDVLTHVLLRRALKESIKQADPELHKACTGMGLWLALNHPEHSHRVRLKVSQHLKTVGKAHLTIACDHRDMWGFSLSERPEDLPSLMSFLPDGSALSFFPDELEPSPPSN